MARPKRTTPWLGARDNGTFYAHWYDETDRQTKRLSLRTQDGYEAEARFAEFLLKGREIRSKEPRGDLKVDTVLDQYLKEHVREECAAPQRQGFAIAHLKAFFGENRLSEIDIALSKEYARLRLEGKVNGNKHRTRPLRNRATVRRELNVLVAACNHARKMKRTTELVHVSLPRERVLGVDDEAPYYTQDELDKIFLYATEIDEETSLFVKLLYGTGARRRSIEQLTRPQVRWPQRRILLQAPGKTSTKKRQPIVPILKSMEPTVERLLEVGGPRRLFERRDFYRVYSRVCADAGIEEGRRHPHLMRHTRATHLLQDGKSLYDVAKLLGDTLATVERVYGHHSHDHLARALED